MKKSIFYGFILCLCLSGQTQADSYAMHECLTNSSGFSWSEQLMSFNECLRTLPRTKKSAKLITCVDSTNGDDLQETVSQLQYCLLKQIDTSDPDPFMLSAISCVRNARGTTLLQRVDTAKRCLHQLPF